MNRLVLLGAAWGFAFGTNAFGALIALQRGNLLGAGLEGLVAALAIGVILGHAKINSETKKAE